LDFKDLKKKVDNALRDVLSKDTFNEIGKMTADQIKTRTRLGKGVPQSEGPFQQLKPLSSATIGIRTDKKKKGKLNPLTTPKKSNLTETGELLDSLKYQSSNTEVRIYIEGPENQKKANDQVAQGRKFMNLSKTEVREIIKYLQKKIEDSFNKG
jgi:hypothetical protein